MYNLVALAAIQADVAGTSQSLSYLQLKVSTSLNVTSVPTIKTEKARFYSDDRTANTLIWDSTSSSLGSETMDTLTIEAVTLSFVG